MYRQCFILGMIIGADLKPRCTRLMIPATELFQIHTTGLFHCIDKIFGGRRTAVVTLEIQIHALAKMLLAQQGMNHANDFRPLVIHGGSIEIIDFNIGIRLNRMCHGAGIFNKLAGAQHIHIIDAFNRSGI